MNIRGNRKTANVLLLLSLFLFMFSCARKVSQEKLKEGLFIYQNGIEKYTFEIPESCRKEYNELVPYLAIANIEFTVSEEKVKQFVELVYKNNIKNYTPRKVENSTKEIIAEWSSKGYRDWLKRITFIEFRKMFDYRLYYYDKLNEVVRKHNIQIKGLLDLDTAVKIGKITGVRYLISGRVKDIDFKYNTNSPHSSYSALLTIQVRIIDTKERKVVGDKEYKIVLWKEKVYSPYFFFVVLLSNAVKEGLVQAVIHNLVAKKDTGFIIGFETRKNGEKLVQVSLGTLHGVRRADEFYVFKPKEVILNGKKVCKFEKLPVILKAPGKKSRFFKLNDEYLDSNSSLTKAIGNTELKIGFVVRKTMK